MKCRVLLPAILLALAVPLAASADPISVTDGYLVLDWTSMGKARFDLLGADQSRFTGSWDFGLVDAMRCSPCAAGYVLSVDAVWRNSPAYELTTARGSATVGGTHYPTPDFPYGFVEFGGVLRFTGGSVAIGPEPPVSDTNIDLHRTYTLPFTLDGFIAGFDNAVYVGPRQVFSSEIVGSGVASIEIFGHQTPAGDTSWRFLRTTYDFQPGEPVPEPASLFLVGTGLLGLGSAIGLKRQRARRPAEQDREGSGDVL